MNQKYHVLSPISNSKNAEAYFDAIDFALNNNNIKNIAITGPYGSGKSSVLETYFKHNIKEKHITISLANFCSDTEFEKKQKRIKFNGSEFTLDNNAYIKEIEINILQQIFHQLKTAQIPFSRFKRINHVGQFKIFGNSVLTLLWLTATYIFFKAFTFNAFLHYTQNLENLKAFFGQGLKTWIIFISAAFFFFGCIFILINTYKLLKQRYFKKLIYKNFEMEVMPDSLKDSALSEHIDDLVYFFIASKENILIIEDLDRFKNVSSIFTKLREINTIINNSPEIQKTDPVKFIYALKDEMFNEATIRTKFFDFIIPIIPISNSENMSSHLRLLFKEIGLNDPLLIDQEIIDDLDLYIHDLRLAKNIVNEFKLFISILNSEENLNIDHCKVFILIVYKNLLPEDFNKTQNSTSFLDHTFRITNNIYKENPKKGRLLKEIITKDKKNNTNWFKTISESFDLTEEIKNNEDFIKYTLINGFIDEDFKNNISNFIPGKLSKSDEKFLRGLRNREKFPSDFPLEKTAAVLKKINERKDYWGNPEILNIYLFKEITTKIHNNYQLNKSNSNESNQQINPEFIGIKLQALKAANSKRLEEFIYKFYEEIINKNAELSDTFTKIIIKNLDNFFIERLEKEELFKAFINLEDIEFIEEYCLYDNIYKNKIINAIISKELLSGYIKTENQFATVTYLTDSLSFKVNKVNPEENLKIIEILYKNNAYELNYHNINVMLEYLNRSSKKNEFGDTLSSKHYSTILFFEDINKEIQILIKYISSNPIEYIESTYKHLPSPQEETKDATLQLLKLLDKNTSYSRYKDIVLSKGIKQYEVDPSECTNNSIQSLLKNNRIKPNWEIITNYFINSGNSINQNLLNYLNNKDNYLLLDKTNPYNLVDKNTIKNFGLDLINNKNVSINAFKSLTRRFDHICNRIRKNTISNEKVLAMIENCLFTISIDTYENLKSEYPPLHINYLIKTYKRKPNEINFSIEPGVILQIMKSKELTPKEIFNLLSKNLSKGIKDNTSMKLVNKLYLQKDILEHIPNDISLTYYILEHNIELEIKIRVAILAIRKTTDTRTLNNIFKRLPAPYKNILDSNETRIESSELNEELVRALKSKNLIKEAGLNPTDHIIIITN